MSGRGPVAAEFQRSEVRASMSTPTSKRSRRTGRVGFGPRGLASYATAHPKRVLAIWGLMALIGIGLTSGLLSSALTTDSGVTSKPESQRAQDLIDERLPGSDALDELVIVRSDQRTVRDAAYAVRVKRIADELRAQADIRSVSTYQSPGGAVLVSRDGHATLMQVVMSDEPKTTSVDHMIATVERANGEGGFAV